MFALEPDFSKTLQPMTKTNGKDLKALSSAEFFKAKAVDAFCQTAARKLRKAKTEITINKKGVLV